MDIVKVCWSGGKDSTAAELLHLQEGNYTKVVNYIPMFTDEIPLITKRHYEFIMNTAERWKQMGAEMYFVDGLTYYDFVHLKRKQGKNKGIPFGFTPFRTGHCTFKNYSKIKALKNSDCGFYYYEDIGIAFDETERHSQLNELKRSILFEKEITERAALDICRKNNLLSPHYEDDTRDGCAICPHGSKKRLEEWFDDYPKARQILIELQDFAKRELPQRYPLRDKKWFI